MAEYKNKKQNSDPKTYDRSYRRRITVEEVVICLSLAMLTVIAFVLLGGARRIYASLEQKYSVDRNLNSVQVIPVPQRKHDPDYDDLNQIADGSDLREEIYTHLMYGDIDNVQSLIQGACTDGVYIWAGWSFPFKMIKFHILTHEIVVKEYSQEEWIFGHINDMTYNPNTGKIYISAGESANRETRGDIAVVDAETLEYEGVIKLTNKNGDMLPVGGIAYDRIHNRYIVSRRGKIGKYYYLLDEHFKYIKRITIDRTESFTVQGIETDGTYLYRGLDDTDAMKGAMFVYDLDGNFVKLLKMPDHESTIELEDIMYDWHGNWFINAAVWPDNKHPNSSFVIYYAGLYSAVDYSQMDRLLTAAEKEFAPERKMSLPTPASIVS